MLATAWVAAEEVEVATGAFVTCSIRLRVQVGWASAMNASIVPASIRNAPNMLNGLLRRLRLLIILTFRVIF